jgi:hypothetical protein
MYVGNRREFLADVGRGMLVAGVGSALATDLGLVSSAWADEEAKRLTFGAMEPLVATMQETPVNKLLPILAEKYAGGADLRTLIAAGSLANARTFGGQDYIGFHTFMALSPALEMSKELPESERALPVFKVLYRNTNRIQQFGGKSKELLHPVEPADMPSGKIGGEVLREATRKQDWNGAERTFAALTKESPGEAFNHLLYAVDDEVDVHRIVLAWRAWVMLDIAGKENANTLLRQSVRYCCNSERPGRNSPVRTILPKLLDQFHLLEKGLGDRKADDAWIDKMSQQISNAGGPAAAEMAAAALAEGMAPDTVAEAISLAANLLLLRDKGREKDDGPKYKGSVHGDSVGVHASDSANAWRNIAKVSNQRNTVASLILGAYHTAGQSHYVNKDAYPTAEQLEKVQTKDPAKLLSELEDAVKTQDQFRAMALVQRCGELGCPPKPIFEVLLKYGVSEDGALHAEKYFRTVTEEFAKTRAAFRWRHLVALARVTASECGVKAPGYDEARKLLKV